MTTTEFHYSYTHDQLIDISGWRFNYCIPGKRWRVKKLFRRQLFSFLRELQNGTPTAAELLSALLNFLRECSSAVEEDPFLSSEIDPHSGRFLNEATKNQTAISYKVARAAFGKIGIKFPFN